jgi:hypothetical protein
VLEDLVLTWEGSMIFDSVLIELAIVMDDSWECQQVVLGDHPCTGGNVA